MPYLSLKRRLELDHEECPIETPGDLTYLYTKVLLSKINNSQHRVEALAHLTDEYLAEHETCFATYAEILGALRAAEFEYGRRMHKCDVFSPIILSDVSGYATSFYAKVVAPYEDSKIEQNGDVYPCD